MKYDDLDRTIVVRTERKNHIIICVFFLIISVFIFAGEFMSNIDSLETKVFLGSMIFATVSLIISIVTFIDIFWFSVTADGNTISVKHNNIKDSFEFSVKDIKKIEFRSQQYRDNVTYFTTIKTSEKTLELSNSLIGYKSMLIYLKDKYDNGIIDKSAISQFDYKTLVENIKYYSKYWLFGLWDEFYLLCWGVVG